MGLLPQPAGLAIEVSTGAVTILSVALLYLPVNRFFELEPLPLPWLLVLATITLAYAVTSEAGGGLGRKPGYS